MKLYNTLSRKIEPIEPRPEHQAQRQLGLYACGPTVYDYTHLGHLRKYTMDDVLVRALRQAGFQVEFVQNITDVGHLTSDDDQGEDKLEKGAKKYGKSVWDIAHEFEDYFWRSMELMGNVKPDVSCRATDHIQQQLAMVVELEKRGFTYEISDDGIYFDTSKLDDYGQLARLDIDNLQAGARVETKGKRNPTDFALWKFERPGEQRAMVWPSPWAERSFPGWHIECTAMAQHYLGAQFEIHTGGIDHIPVHHTNEIAQAEASTGQKPFVKYWVHHNFLQVEGEKMSKSLGNFLTIDDILERNHSPQALRLLFLMSHYRSQLNFTWKALAGAEKSWQRLLKAALELEAAAGDEVWADWVEDPAGGLTAAARQLADRFEAAIQDDLKTPEAVAVVWEALKVDQLQPADLGPLLLWFDQVLGFGLAQPEAFVAAEPQQVQVQGLPDDIQQLINQRAAARQAKDWAEADRLRDALAAEGYQVIDTDEGQEIRQSS